VDSKVHMRRVLIRSSRSLRDRTPPLFDHSVRAHLMSWTGFFREGIKDLVPLASNR
jgi:hypothetical protein